MIVAATSWRVRSTPRNLYCTEPVAGWDGALFILIYSDSGEDRILRISKLGEVEQFWKGTVSSLTDLRFVDGPPGFLAFVVSNKVHAIDRDGKARILHVGGDVGPVSVFRSQLLVTLGRRFLLLPAGEIVTSGMARAYRGKILQAASVGDSIFLLSTERFGERRMLEQAEIKERSSSWRRWRLPDGGSWRLMDGADRCVLWDVDGRWMYILQQESIRDVVWEPPEEALIWVRPGDHRGTLMVAYNTGYSLLKF